MDLGRLQVIKCFAWLCIYVHAQVYQVHPDLHVRQFNRFAAIRRRCRCVSTCTYRPSPQQLPISRCAPSTSGYLTPFKGHWFNKYLPSWPYSPYKPTQSSHAEHIPCVSDKNNFNDLLWPVFATCKPRVRHHPVSARKKDWASGRARPIIFPTSS